MPRRSTPTPVWVTRSTSDCADGLGLAGTVARTSDHSTSLVLAGPGDGTAFIAAEGAGGQTSVSIWSYLYGADQVELAARDAPRWTEWLEANAPTPHDC